MKIFRWQNVNILIQTFMIISIITLFSVAFADPPTRVARIGYTDGSISLLPYGETNWIDAILNRPLTDGDRLWIDDNAKSELQFGGADLRISSATDLEILKIDNQTTQLGLNQGTINLRLWNNTANLQYEVGTPNLVFSTSSVGDYRIDVNANLNTTTISVRRGQAIVSGENNTTYQLEANQRYTFTGSDLSSYAFTEILPPDDFDDWCAARDELRIKANSIQSQFVSEAVIGYEDLTQYGEWSTDTTYGNVWSPSQVSKDWTPYREGSWLWQEPYGWTWVDDEPWGFAPFHYGRWAFLNDRWFWIPGPMNVEPVYAPALVVFIVADVGGIGWLPLGPGDIYVPPYNVTQNYFNIININNTYINNQYLVNAYQYPHERRNYFNWRDGRAFTAVPAAGFVSGETVTKMRRPIAKDVLQRADILHRLDLKPTRESMIGRAALTTIKPPRDMKMRPLIIKSSPAERVLQRAKAMKFEYKKVKGDSIPIRPSSLEERNKRLQQPVTTQPIQSKVLPSMTRDVKPFQTPDAIRKRNQLDQRPNLMRQPGQQYQRPQIIKQPNSEMFQMRRQQQQRENQLKQLQLHQPHRPQPTQQPNVEEFQVRREQMQQQGQQQMQRERQLQQQQIQQLQRERQLQQPQLQQYQRPQLIQQPNVKELQNRREQMQQQGLQQMQRERQLQQQQMQQLHRERQLQQPQLQQYQRPQTIQQPNGQEFQMQQQQQQIRQQRMQQQQQLRQQQIQQPQQVEQQRMQQIREEVERRKQQRGQ